MKAMKIALILMLLSSVPAFSQGASLEVAGGFVIGYGSAVETDDGADGYTNSTATPFGLAIQIGPMWKKAALLVEGNLCYVLPQKYFMWNAGAIFEFYPLVFDDGNSKLGIGVGGGYAQFFENAPYVRAEIPVILGPAKLGINGEYYFHDSKPVFRAGIMIFVRGEAVVDFLKEQTFIPISAD